MFSAIAALGHQTGHGMEEKSMAAAAEFTGLAADFRGRFLSTHKLAQSLRELVEEIDYWGHLVSENKDARDKDVVNGNSETSNP